MSESTNVQDLQSDLLINPTELTKECSEQPSRYVYWAARAAEADAAVDRARLEQDILEASLDRQVREELSVAGEKVTEGRVGMEIRLKPEYRKGREAYADAHKNQGILKAAERGYFQRKDMIYNLVQMDLRESRLKDNINAGRHEMQQGA